MDEFEAYMNSDAAQETDEEIDYGDHEGGDRVLAFLITHGELALIPNIQLIQIDAGSDPDEALQRIGQLARDGYIAVEEKTVQLLKITPAGKRHIRDRCE